MLQQALGIVRQSNPRRTVIVRPYFVEQHPGPGQTRPARRRAKPHRHGPLLQSVLFTHQGAASPGLMKDKTGVSWNGTSQEQQAIVKDFDKAQTWAQNHVARSIS